MYRNSATSNRRRHPHTARRLQPKEPHDAIASSRSRRNRCCWLACLGLAGRWRCSGPPVRAARALPRSSRTSARCGACRSPWTCCRNLPFALAGLAGVLALAARRPRAPEQRAARDGGAVLRRPAADGGRLELVSLAARRRRPGGRPLRHGRGLCGPARPGRGRPGERAGAAPRWGWPCCCSAPVGCAVPHRPRAMCCPGPCCSSAAWR